MKKAILIFLTAIFLSGSMHAAKVSEKHAQEAALNFLKQKGLETELSIVYSGDYFHVFGNSHSFVIVATQDAVKPVLGYSTENAFINPSSKHEQYAENVFGLLRAYDRQIDSLVSINDIQTEAVKKQWDALLNGKTPLPQKGMTSVDPLLTTTWGQGWPYNAYCPDASGGPGGKAWAGCVATALAQILHYNYSGMSNYQGVGSYSYAWQSYPTTSADFGNTVYDMASMPNSIGDIGDPGAGEIATLTYHAAVGCRSMWGASGTGVMLSTNGGTYIHGDYPQLAILQNYLPMAASAKWVIREQYTDAEWTNLLKTELDDGRVVYYRGSGSSGHAWVCDGYDNSDFFHFNWGWDGDYNGYFSLDAINPGGQNFNGYQMAMIGLAPNDGSTLTSDLTWSGTMNVNSINVPDAVTLTISAGTTVNFSQGSSMRVWGRVLSNGTESNYVTFTAVNQTDGWEGIDYHDDYLDRMVDNDTSFFDYTQVQYSQSSGLYSYKYGKIVLDYCKINDNEGHNGGGVFSAFHHINLLNTEMFNNYAISGGGAIFINCLDGLSSFVNNCHMYDNTAGSGGAVYSIGDNIFEKCVFESNFAANNGGVKVFEGNPEFINCEFLNNDASSGGAVFVENASPIFSSCLVANNSAEGGGSFIFTSSSGTVVNSTIVNNYALNVGGAANIIDSDPLFQNCIVYGNVAGNGNNFFLATTGADPDFLYSDVEGGVSAFGGPGAGAYYDGTYQNNIDENPLFVDPTAGAGASYDASVADFSLQGASPGVNAGDTTGVSALLPELDLAGNARIEGTIDMGAYEYGQPPVIINQPDSMSACASDNVIFYIEALYAEAYQWYKNSNILPNATSDSLLLNNVGQSDTGHYYCVVSNTHGTATSEIAALTVALPPETVIIFGPDQACQGDTVRFVADTLENLYENYQWGVSSGMEIVSAQGMFYVDVHIIDATSPGEISCYATNLCGNGPAGTHSLTVNPLPGAAGAITGDSDVCRGEEGLVYSVGPISNAADYNWQLPEGFSITAGANTPSITVSLSETAQSGNIIVYASNACGQGQSAQLAINVHFVTAEAGEDQTVNYGQSAQLDGATGGDGAIETLWTANNSGWTSTEEDPVTENLTATTEFTMQVSNDYGCQAEDETIVNVEGGALSVIAVCNPEEICTGESSLLSAQTSGGTGTYSYSWASDPPGFTSTEQGPQVYPEETTTYTVEVNDGNETVSDYTTVTVNPLPGDAGAIAGDSDVCRSEEGLIYSVGPISNAADYNWQLPEGFSITAGDNSPSITVSLSETAQSGAITVYATNACGQGQSSQLAVDVHYVTADAGEGQSINYGQSTQLNGSITGDGDINILWTASNSSWTSTQEDPVTENLEATTEFSLSVANNYGCHAEDAMIVNVVGGPLAVTALADPGEICKGANSQLRALSSGGTGNYSYNWSSEPSGFSSTEQDPLVSPTATTTYFVEVNDGNESVSSQTTVTVNAPPESPSKPGGPELIDLKQVISSDYSTNSPAGAESYHWQLEPATAGQLQANGNALTIQWDPGYRGYCYLSVATGNECGQSANSEALEIYVDYIDAITSPEGAKTSLYPNPGKGMFRLKTATGIKRVSVLDMNGSVLEERNVSIAPGTTYELNMQAYSKGMYMIRLQGQQEIQLLKLMIL